MRTFTLFAALLAFAGAPARAQAPTPPPAQQKPTPPANVNQTLRDVGVAISKSLDVFSLSPQELDIVIAGIREGAKNPKIQLDPKAQQAVNDLAKYRMSLAGEKEKAKGDAYLKKMEAEKGAIKTESGAIVIPQKPGTGPSPKADSKVKVHYTGTLVDGKVFDSSVQRGQPAEFPLNGVIKCWTEALQKMKVGEKAKVVCPSNIAYGPEGRPPVIPGNAVLTFDIELLAIE